MSLSPVAIASGPSRFPARDRVAIFALLAVLIGAIFYIASKQEWRVDEPSRVADAPMFYSPLPPDAVEANAMFRARISNSFPLLTPEDKMVRQLLDQGFRSDGWFGKRMTYRRLAGGRGRCDIAASVTWEADNQGRIAALDARYLRTPGCVDGLR